MQGMIFAAGLGTRLKPWTEHHPKALVEVGGKPMLQRVIENMSRAGIKTVTINVHHFSEQIIEFLAKNNNFGLSINISDETDRLLDTGGAIVKASKFIDTEEPLLIHNADIYTDFDLSLLIDHHNAYGADATLLTSTRTSTRQLLFDKNNRLYGWINNITGETLPTSVNPNIYKNNRLSFNGIHIINKRVLTHLKTIAPSDAFPVIPQYVALSGLLTFESYTFPYEYTWIDIGKPESLEKARLISSKP